MRRSKGRATRTKAQREATARNHLILRLRGATGLFGAVCYQSGDLASVKAARDAQKLIDFILTRMGAETEADRKERFRKEFLDD